VCSLIADDLVRAIEQDDLSRQKWMADYAKGIE
jgi:hypothetical protein